MMAETIFILGAGASKAAGAPLMAEFIDRIEDLLETQRDSIRADDFEIVLKLVRDRFSRLYAATQVDVQNIESVFGLVEMGKLIRRLPNLVGKEVERVADAIRFVLAETIELTCLFPFDAVTGFRPHDEYAALVEKTCARERGKHAFLTFNYDLALDLALHFAGCRANYALKGHTTAGVPLLKLHGSLNWRMCEACDLIRLVGMQQLLAEHATTQDGASRRPLRSIPTLPDLVCSSCGNVLPEMPSIVPPTWNKTQYHHRFAGIWTRAAAELSEARNFYVIGYSLPKSDAFFRDLLALGLHGGARPRKFMVVDPSEQVANRFRELLGPVFTGRFEHWSGTFSSFVQERL